MRSDRKALFQLTCHVYENRVTGPRCFAKCVVRMYVSDAHILGFSIDFYRSFGDAVEVVSLPIGCLPAEIHTVAVIKSQVRP